MNIFAHRGLSALYSENTMTAFSKAEEKSPYGIENDIQLTRDNKIIIMHDENLKRTTGMDAFIKDTDLGIIRLLNADFKNKDSGFEKVPTLEEYLDWVKDRNIVTNIEIKSSVVYYPGLEEAAVKLVNDFGLIDRIIFSSFNPLSLVAIKKINSSIKCGFLCESQLINAGSCCRKFGFEYYHPCIEGLTKEIVDECHDNGVGVNVWTVNKKEELDKLKELGADGAFCNNLFDL